MQITVTNFWEMGDKQGVTKGMTRVPCDLSFELRDQFLVIINYRNDTNRRKKVM